MKFVFVDDLDVEELAYYKVVLDCCEINGSWACLQHAKQWADENLSEGEYLYWNVSMTKRETDTVTLWFRDQRKATLFLLTYEGTVR